MYMHTQMQWAHTRIQHINVHQRKLYFTGRGFSLKTENKCISTCMTVPHLTNLSMPRCINCSEDYDSFDRASANWGRKAKNCKKKKGVTLSFKKKWASEPLTKQNNTKRIEQGGGLDMISGCAATRMTMINAAFPGIPSAGLHLSPWWDAFHSSQPCKYNRPLLLFSVRSITTKQRLQLWQIGWMCLLGTNM